MSGICICKYTKYNLHAQIKSLLFYLLYLKRNAALSDSVSSLHVLYTDSLKLERKTIKKERSKTFFYKATTTVAAALGIYGIIVK